MRPGKAQNIRCDDCDTKGRHASGSSRLAVMGGLFVLALKLCLLFWLLLIPALSEAAPRGEPSSEIQGLLPPGCKIPGDPNTNTQIWKVVNRQCGGKGKPFGYVLCIHEQGQTSLDKTSRAVRRRGEAPMSSGLPDVVRGMPLCDGDELITWKGVTVWVQEVARQERAAGQAGQTWRVESFTELKLSWSESVLMEGLVSLFADPLFEERRITLGERGKGWAEKPPQASTSKSDVTLQVVDGCRGVAQVRVAAGAKAGEEHFIDVERPLGVLPVRVRSRVRGGEARMFLDGGRRVADVAGDEAQELVATNQTATEALADARSDVQVPLEAGISYFEPPEAVAVEVKGSPESLQLLLDGKPVRLRGGNTRLLLLPGTYHVEATAAGYLPKDTWVEIEEGKAQVLELSLEKRLPVSTTAVEATAPPVVAVEEAPGPTTTLLPGSTESITWVSIPGTGPEGFWMGSPEGEGDTDEHPRHKVTVPTFQMSKTEVTNAQYNTCVKAGKCTAPGWDTCYSWLEGSWKEGKAPESFREDNKPVVCVDWAQAKAFAAWVAESTPGVRLPSEAEWEYAARGKEGRKYPWGNTPEPSCDLAIFDPSSSMDSKKWGCGESGTWPVCSKTAGNTPSAATGGGLCDMGGNVWEWVEDCYEGNYKDAPADGSARTVCSGSLRVLRGGSWYNAASVLRGANRDRDRPSDRDVIVGFRVVWPASRGAAP